MIVRPASAGQPQRTMLRAGDQTRDFPEGLIAAALGASPLQLASDGVAGGGTFALRLPWDDTSDAPLVAVGEVRAAAWGADGRNVLRGRGVGLSAREVRADIRSRPKSGVVS
mgnify:CR=1 FL=1